MPSQLNWNRIDIVDPYQVEFLPDRLNRPTDQKPSTMHGDLQLASLMAAAMGRKDYYTQLHAQRVSTYSERLANRLELREKEVDEIALGGMLHDVGKLALSDRLFSNRCAELTEEMWGEVHNHPLIGATLLKQTRGEGIIYDAVLYHHERIDGSGYPFGLHGQEIPLSARIVSVADCFDAITTDRPYQRHKNLKQAINILKDMAGKYLDAELVALFVEDIRKVGMIAPCGRRIDTRTAQ